MKPTAFVVTLGLLVIFTPTTGNAQTAPARLPTFEVASVKPSNPNPPDVMSGLARMSPRGGRLTVANFPLRLLIRAAYGLQDSQLVGGPSDLLSQKFDIVAKAEDGAGQNAKDLLLMLRPLITERFKLKAHTELRESSIYALIRSRSDGTLGPEMKASTSDCASRAEEAQQRMLALENEGPAAMMKALAAGPIPCAMTPVMPPPGGAVPTSLGLRGNGLPVAALIELLTQMTGRTVVDKTGLYGLYDWELHFDPEVVRRMAGQFGTNLPMPTNLPPADSPALLTAIQEQLGLKLESQKGPVEHLVIDNIEGPTAD